MNAGLPFAARLVATGIPARDREAVVGDLVEEAEYRRLDGAMRAMWLARQCCAIAIGLSAARVRDWIVLPPLAEIAAGLAVDRRGALRAVPIRDALLLCASIAVLAYGAGVLVATLMAAAGL